MIVRALAAVLAALSSQAGLAAPVHIGMFDTMRFSPDQVSAKPGETIRFVVHNKGKIQHEIVIGTPAEIAQQRQAMHHGPGMAHVAPGARGQLRWRADRAGEFEFACLLPGHYEAGMRGTITVTKP